MVQVTRCFKRRRSIPGSRANSQQHAGFVSVDMTEENAPLMDKSVGTVARKTILQWSADSKGLMWLTMTRQSLTA